MFRSARKTSEQPLSDVKLDRTKAYESDLRVMEIEGFLGAKLLLTISRLYGIQTQFWRHYLRYCSRLLTRRPPGNCSRVTFRYRRYFVYCMSSSRLKYV